MNTKPLALIAITVGLGAALAAQAQMTTFAPQPTGSQMKMDGTSTLHDWSVKSAVIGGSLELDSKFLADPTKAQPGPVPANVNAVIPVRTLKSYTTKMDTVMYQAMKMTNFPRIEYKLTDLKLKETPKSANGPFVFDSSGTLAIAGITNKIAFPVTMTKTGNSIKTTGATTVKMSDYKVSPPTPSIPIIGKITTGDEVKLNFDWVTVQK